MSGTYISKIPVLVVALVIGIVLVTSAVVPLASDYSEAKTFKNAGYYDMTYTETDNLVFKWESSTPNQVKVNDEVISLPQSDIIAKTILCGDNWLVRYAYESSLKTFVQFYGASGSQVIASVSAGTDITITCSNGSVSVENTASTPDTFSATYTHLYVVSNSGDLVMKTKDNPVYLNGDTPVVAMGLSKVGTVSNVGIIINGTIDDGFTWDIFRGTGVTFSNEAAVYTEVADYLDLYSLEKLTATATNSTGSSDLTYSYFIVPAEVSADPDNPAAYKNLVRVVPLMAFIMLVVAAAGMVYFKNRD